MSHYFTEDKNLKHEIVDFDYYFRENKFTFTTDAGLFSKGHIDPATEILLNAIAPLSGSLFDLGCGYGVIGIVLAKTYGLKLTQADVNGAAVELTIKNAKANGVGAKAVKSDCFDNVSGTFDTITLNPPIHAGKAVTYRMYEESIDHLNPGGKFYVVTLKKHGAESTEAKLKSVYGNCETVYKKKGVFVFCCVK
ncbi:MAG TPA: methyltransferase [Oscillospiraceae bacterium]|nr:methyltransferase [Oscillospiraceae bacterium]HPF55858.1 methyltransferase [Clostridiales bacterium]HPK35650.1 methyltransferase [Oscillospiraceae bacterium]HPR74713.1 methyltransferase [Oscillospiraceae bacterium]